MSKVKLLTSLILLLAILCFTVLAEDTAAVSGLLIPEGYMSVAASEKWTLYLCEDNLGLIMQDNATGKFMTSTVPNADEYKDNVLWKGFYQSGITLEYIERTVNKYPWADLVYTRNVKAFTYNTNGFSCEVKYPDLGLAYTVTVALEGNDVVVTIPRSGIREEMPDQYCVGSLYVYPFMGYSYMGETGGYILIPDGQGALVSLEDNEGRFSSPYTTSVYGTNIGLVDLTSGAVLNNYSTNNPVEQTKMPIFGVVHADTGIGYLGVLEEGDISAAIQAYFNGVSNMAFDWIGAQYTYRVVYAQSTGPSSGTVNMRTQRAKKFDIKQHFCFVSGKDADYTGLAKEYRGYLQKRRTFQDTDIQRAFDIQIDFLCGERKNGLISTTAVTMTTANQAAEILEKLGENGVASISSVFRGWQNNGYTGGRPTTGYKPAGNIGGKNGFSQLFKTAKELGLSVYLEADLASMVPDTAGTLIYSALKKVNSNTFSMPLFGWVYGTMQYLMPAKSLEIARHVADDFAKNSVPGVSLDGITKLVTDYMHRGVYFDTADCAGYYEQAAKAFADSMPVLLNESNAYLWKHGDALTGMPIGGSDYIYTAREVPFMAIALSGCIPVYVEYSNFQADSTKFFLKLVEQGVRPSFLITWEDPINLQETNANNIYSSKFSLYEELITEWYKKLSALHALINGSSIDTHVQEGNVVTVTYENGLHIYINYGNKEAMAAGIMLPALSYKAVASDGK